MNESDELEKAHLDYERRKNEILTKLQIMKSIPTLLSHEIMWVDQVIEFIKEKEI